MLRNSRINTPLQRGGDRHGEVLNRFSGLPINVSLNSLPSTLI